MLLLHLYRHYSVTKTSFVRLVLRQKRFCVPHPGPYTYLLHEVIIYVVSSTWMKSVDLRQVLWARRQCARVTTCTRPHSRRLLRQDSMSGRKTLPTRPEPEPTLRQVLPAMSSTPGPQQAGVRHWRRHVPELLSSARGGVSQGQSHPGCLQGALQT
jgi:hypothetical protein